MLINGESQDEAVTTAPEAGDTTTPAPVDIESSDGGDEDTDENQDQQPKTFTQEDLDKAVQKRLGMAQRKWERDQAAKASQPTTPVLPKIEDYGDNTQKYLDDLATFKAHHIVEGNKVKEQQAKVKNDYADREEAAREKYTDFKQVVYKHPNDGGPAVSEVMLAAIEESEIGPDIAYHLGKNPDESYRIFGLSPVAQAREIGKIEAKLTTNPPEVKKVSNAPEPINPVGSRAQSPKLDTSDPDSVKKMGPSNWIKQRNADIAKRNKA